MKNLFLILSILIFISCFEKQAESPVDHIRPIMTPMPLPSLSFPVFIEETRYNSKIIMTPMPIGTPKRSDVSLDITSLLQETEPITEE